MKVTYEEDNGTAVSWLDDYDPSVYYYASRLRQSYSFRISAPVLRPTGGTNEDN